MRKSWLLALIAILFLGVITTILYITQSKDEQTVVPDTTQTTVPIENQTGSTEQTKSFPVQVFFSKHPESDNDPSKTFPVNRVSPDIGVAKFSITELLSGPTQQEQSLNYFTYVRLRDDTSNCDGNDFTLSIKDTIATLQFCKTFDHVGSVSDGQAEANIKNTLMQFNSISKVIILNNNGDCEFDLSGLNLCLK